MVSRCLLAWLLVLPHLDLTAAMHAWTDAAATTSYTRLESQPLPNQLTTISDAKVSSFSAGSIFSWIRKKTFPPKIKIDPEQIAFAEDPENLKIYYNAIFDTEHVLPDPKRSPAYLWLQGLNIENHYIQNAFCHKYVTTDKIVWNLLEKFKSEEKKNPQELSGDMKRQLELALNELLQMQQNEDQETAVRIAHYISVFCEITGTRPKERHQLNKLIIKHIKKWGQDKHFNRHGEYLYVCMRRIWHASPSKIRGRKL